MGDPEADPAAGPGRCSHGDGRRSASSATGDELRPEARSSTASRFKRQGRIGESCAVLEGALVHAEAAGDPDAVRQAERLARTRPL